MTKDSSPTPATPYPMDGVVGTVQGLSNQDGDPVTLQLIADGSVRWDRSEG